MAPNFIAERVDPCDGLPVHILCCGHTVQASFLHLKESSKCAPNCRDVNISTNAEPNFICPTCYASELHHKHRKFMDDCRAKDTKGTYPENLYATIERIKRAHNAVDDFDKQEHSLWCEVGLGKVKFEKAVSVSYKRKIEAKGLRECKSMDTGCSEYHI